MEPDRIIRRPEVEAMTGLGCTLIYDKMKAGTFPKNLKLADRAVGWSQAAVQQWIADLIEDEGKLHG